ncbi:MAG: 2-succinyl-5-enolpyruvyl-6-hydroxy-3-cyclohexene-1-carboxylic-acid synthase [Oscillatoriales cyanobacterium SM2_2_1]|nr:2-succinyl-5-enolpyruvyl-6-hydroxy-3-cyclohexene-1-carboxylic-acid synthase [Oscillatoriales cyanobacterium SM2_2_1]
MNYSNRNTVWASVALEALYGSGVRLLCLSPGSRSTPLAIAAAELRQLHSDFRILVHLDERSGGFFALGAAKRQRQPIALLCTSGTAAANYFPAVVEAYYSQVPLVILTADRPPALRDCGSGQTIDQLHLYGTYVRWFFEVGTPEVGLPNLRSLRANCQRAVATAGGHGDVPAGPVHLNFPFAEPLTPTVDPNLPVIPELPQCLPRTHQTGKRTLPTEAIATLAKLIAASPRGAIVVGVYDAPPEFAQAVRKLSQRCRYPLLADALGLDRIGAIAHFDSFLRSSRFAESYAPQLIIRFGAMPISKFYGQWTEQHHRCQKIVVGSPNLDPIHGNTQFLNVDATSFCEQLSDYLENFLELPWQNQHWRLGFTHAETITLKTIQSFLASQTELFEGKVFAELGDWLPDRTMIYVSNSMPIRDLDTFFHSYESHRVLCNRGANGIDGTLSSALGAAWQSELPLVLVCGDLAFFHDLSSLHTGKNYNIKLTIILLNNNGGGIFEFLPIAQHEPPFEELFATPHNLDFEPLAIAYGADYERIETWEQFRDSVLQSLRLPGVKVLEVGTKRSQNYQLHQRLWHQIITALEQNLYFTS